MNAELIVENKIGISLINPKRALRRLEKDICWPTPLFSHSDVEEKLGELLTN
jgi:hypothetical protein